MSDIKPKLPFSLSDALGLLRRVASRLFRVRLFWIVGGCLVFAYGCSASCSTYVPPNMLGLRQVYYGDGAGIKQEVYGPGLHFVVAAVERLHLFPHDLQVVN